MSRILGTRSKLALVASLIALAPLGAAVPAASAPASATPASATPTTNQIAWREGDVDEAFSAAAAENKPVLLYWGARWCPPCNRLKATLFTEPEFIAETRNFIPVHLDGDSSGAQRWGEYFGIAGYPTLIVLRPDRREITRLSDGAELDRLPEVLALVVKRNATAAELHDKAMAAPETLTADDWALLASYSWEEDQGPLAGSGGKPALLEKLAAACPVEALKPHFALLAFAARTASPGDGAKPEAGDRAADARLLKATLSDPARLRADYAIIEESGADMVAAVSAPGSPERRSLEALLESAMDRVAADSSLPLTDRVGSLAPLLDLYHRDHGEQAAIPTALADKAKALAAMADQAARTPFERQSVITDAAELLDEAGERTAAKALLTAELKRSEEPYYAMVVLANIAREEGDKQAAIGWLRQSYDAATGPATRAQWGVRYVTGLAELAPGDAAAIEQAADSVIDEMTAHPDVFHERTRKNFGRLQTALEAWAKANRGAPVLARLHQRMQGVCEALPDPSDARKDCTGWLAADERQKA